MIQNALKCQLDFIHYSVKANLEEVTHEDSVQAPAGGGNSINWVLGHMLNTRNMLLSLFGAEPVMDEAQGKIYGRHSPPLGPDSDCLALEELLRRYDSSQATILEMIRGTDDAAMQREVPDLFDPDKRQTCAEQVAALSFHEAYHAGQIGVIRRAIGKVGAIQ